MDESPDRQATHQFDPTKSKAKKMQNNSKAHKPDAHKPQENKGKPWVPSALCRDGAVVLGNQLKYGAPPAVDLMLVMDQADTRLFVRAGKLIRPYAVALFQLQRIVKRPEAPRDEAQYLEVERFEFDQTDCVQVQVEDIQKVNDNLELLLRCGQLPTDMQKIVDHFSNLKNKPPQKGLDSTGMERNPDPPQGDKNGTALTINETAGESV